MDLDNIGYFKLIWHTLIILSDMLKIFSERTASYVFNIFNKHSEILKEPTCTAFEEFRLRISSSISTAVIGERKKLFSMYFFQFFPFKA